MHEVNKSTNQDPVITGRAFSTEENVSEDFTDNKNLTEESNDFSEEQNNTAIKQLLSSYEIGAKLRGLRLKKKMALIDLGKQTGLSASMLSQLENGKLIPTLPTLVRISSVFDVGLDYFFGNQKQKKTVSIIRSNERPEQQHVSPVRDQWTNFQLFSPRDRSLQTFLLEISSGENEVAGRIQEGGKFIHILEGSVSVTYNNESYELNRGDSIYFDSSERHTFQSRNGNEVRALVVATPPRS